MIVLDTHIWIWWVHGNKQLTKTQAQAIKAHETNVIGVSCPAPEAHHPFAYH